MNMLMRRTWAEPMSKSWTQSLEASRSHGEPYKAYSSWKMDGAEYVINCGPSSRCCAHSFGFGACSRLEPPNGSFYVGWSFEVEIEIDIGIQFNDDN